MFGCAWPGWAPLRAWGSTPIALARWRVRSPRLWFTPGGSDDGGMAVSPTSLPPEATVPEPSPELLARAVAVRRAATGLAQSSDGERRAALLAMADALDADRQAILAANRADLEAAASDGLAGSSSGWPSSCAERTMTPSTGLPAAVCALLA